ncbi:aminotransferase class I/II-fold pyridoxal phosphate-dependent enzyme [Streptomyces rapamycinicus]|uniref:Aminotransferase n=2 Tax=Streptomyces rapamycinicus TaxID=1226757 RepID=A0A0A0NR65_STRRN|nr:aminotransferase class I/II-fold pyridoxal phosphate-dependent enzyme [Streptomyces rapamycinicus]AGP57000.1 aminotransferase [Streptomyces rapamycinicus NRRL 5491]MBB4784628.1 (S)-3,5-dihydroxyphenylglycine transaminase [Streptomyces rapamycinicus]RLV79890.1 aminotransferase [Streptomyces rapamycinicus NRRL 5491]UTO64915.1 aminotransferase class I/II-fold pyridoxal phosphate-dependent enzyme [Streptomyces rapamycinicus]UTP32870.1 aminotransferase class I/II-fold pyridoxal phosphate-depende
MTGRTAPSGVSRPPLSLDEYAERARARLDPAVWDFIEGGAGEERTLAANRAAFDRIRLSPRVLTGAGECDPSTTVLGRRWGAPVAVAPMAYHTLMHPDGETATARAAGAAGLPLVVSTFAGRTYREIAAATTSPLWLQVYCFRDRATTRRLIEHAAAAGIEALVLTADTPRLGRRLRDLRNDFRLPPHIAPANLPADEADYSSPSEHGRTGLDPSLDWSVIAWLRSVSGLPVLVKGVMTAEDARRAIAAGVDGIVVSNHGGRQLDGAPATLDVLAPIAAAVDGRCALLLDGGVRRGRDVLGALALGADAVLLGRPVLHGLAVAGGNGAAGVLGLVLDELSEAMTLTGTATVADADASLLAGVADTTPARLHKENPHRSVTNTSPPTASPDAITATATATATEENLHRSVADTPTTPHVTATLHKENLHRSVADTPTTPHVTATLHKENLHRSVSDPVLDTMNFLNEITGRFPDVVSFAPGRPYEEFFDKDEILDHIRRYLDHLAAGGASDEAIRTALYQYGPTAGQIRGLISDSLRADEGIDAAPGAIVVTVGAQEGMLLALRALFADPGDVLLVASPCYVGITGAASLLGVPVHPVEERADGLDVADVEAAVLAERTRGRRPRAFYVVPDHSNPSGNTMSRRAREELLELAARHDLLILEDSPYRLVSPGVQLPTLKSMDHARRVIHLGSYSKSVFPSARVGFVVADQPVRDPSGAESLLADELAKIKSMVTVNTPALSQAAVAGALLACDGRLTERNAVPAKHYGEALRVTLEQLDRHFPEDVRDRLGIGWNRPSGGFFLTVRVPFPADNAALLRSAEDHGVIWTPMAYFYPGPGGERSIRLSFSYLSPAEIEDGIARLAAFLRAEIERPGATGPTSGRDT